MGVVRSSVTQMGDTLFFGFIGVCIFTAVMVVAELPRRIVRSWFRDRAQRDTANLVALGVSALAALVAAVLSIWWIKQPVAV